MSKIQNKIDLVFNQLTEYINRLPITNEAKNYIWLDSFTKFYDSYQPIDEEGTKMTYGIQTEWQLKKFREQFNSNISKLRINNIKKWTEELNKIDTNNAIDRVNYQLHQIKQKKLLEKIGGDKINNFDLWLDEYLSSQLDYLHTKNSTPKSKLDINPQQLKTKLSDSQIENLYHLLISHVFLSKETNKNNFILALSGKENNTSSSKIIWLKNKQLLRELLIPLKPPKITQAAYIKLISRVFIDKNKRPISLPKNKTMPNVDSDTIKDILNKIATM